MSKVAYSADGVSHTFPDDTPDSVIDRVMLDYARQQRSVAKPEAVSKPAPRPASTADWFKFSAAKAAPAKPDLAAGMRDIMREDTSRRLAGEDAGEALRRRPPAPVSYDLGVRPTSLELRELATGKKVKPTAAESFGAFAARAAAPTAAAVAAGIPGGEVGGSVLGPPGAVLGALATSIPAGIAASKAQDTILENIPEDLKAKVGQADWQLEAASREHPYASYLGSALPGALTGRPTRAIGPLLGSSALGGGLEFAQEFMTGRNVDPGKVALATMLGAASARHNRLGRKIYGTPDTELESVIRRSPMPADVARARQQALIEAGVTPVPLEVLDPHRATVLSQQAAEASPTRAAELLRKYADTTQERLPTEAAPAVEALAPVAPGRTPAAMEAEAQRAVERAAPTAVVPPGEGGRAVQTRLTNDFNASEKRMNDAYDAAANTPDARLEPLDSTAPDATWVRKGDKYVNTLTNETRPASSMGPKNGEAIGERVIEALKRNATDLEDAETAGPVLRQVQRLGSAATARDLLDVERILTRIARENQGTPKGNNARIARNELRRSIDELDSAGRFVDEFGYSDSDATKGWRDAIAAAREHHSVFSKDDAIEALSNPTYRGQEGRTTELDPDYASTHLLGPNTGVSLKANSSRDLKALRDYLGADSPEWETLRKEAAQRVLGDDPTKAQARIEKFDKNPKDFVDLILTPEDRAVAARGAAATKSAEQVEAGTRSGLKFEETPPTDFANTMAELRGNPKALEAQRVAVRARLNAALSKPDTAFDLLKRLASNDNPDTAFAQTNLSALLGARETADFVRKAQTLVQRVETARGLRPPTVPGATPAPKGSHLDEAAAQVAGTVAGGPVKGFALRKLWAYLRGRGMSESEATRLATDALDPAKTDATMAFIEKMYGQSAAQAFRGRLRAAGAKSGNAIRGATAVVTRAGSSEDTAPGRREPLTQEAPPSEEEAPEPPPENTDVGAPPSVTNPAYDASIGLPAIRAAILAQEGTGKNPLSSATGKGQIIDSTFVGYARKLYPDLTKGMSDAEVLKLRNSKIEGTDQTIEDPMLDVITQDNVKALSSIGAPVNATTVYLAHFFGPGDVQKVLAADGGTPISDVVGRDVIRSNPSLKGKTVAQVVDMVASLMEQRLRKRADNG